MNFFVSAEVICILFVCHASTFGQTVISNSNLQIGYSGEGFKSIVFQDAAATKDTSAAFAYDGTTLSCVFNSNTDEGSDWYVVELGDRFTRATIAAGHFAPLATFGPTCYPAVNIGPGDVYLGINTGLGVDKPDDRTAYGWVHLRPNNGVLQMVANVMSYDGPGIIVGTSALVPEPTTLMGLGFCFLALTSIRHRKT